MLKKCYFYKAKTRVMRCDTYALFHMANYTNLGGLQMNIVISLIGGLIFITFPFLVLQKSKKMKEENTEEAKKNFVLFLICSIPVPVVAFLLLLLGLKTFM